MGTEESINDTIEAVVQLGLKSSDEQFLEQSAVNQKEFAVQKDESNSCKVIDLADLPLSQVNQLRKEIKRSILQEKKEKYKELFRKKKMNGTLKLKAKCVNNIMTKSIKKWKGYKKYDSVESQKNKKKDFPDTYQLTVERHDYTDNANCIANCIANKESSKSLTGKHLS